MKNLFVIGDEVMLDNAASTPPFKKVLARVDEVLLTYGSVHRGFGRRSAISTETYEEARSFMLKKMKATREDTLFWVSNATDGINRLSLMLLEEKEKTGRNIVIVSELEHSANLLPWINFHLLKVRTNELFEVDLSHLEELLRENKGKVLAVSLAGASNVAGTVLPVGTVNRLIKEIDESVWFIVDASQYAPHHEIDLSTADFFVASGHKAYAPFGIGFVAGKKRLMRNMKYAFKGGGDVIFIDENDIPLYKDPPFNHEIGTPNFVGAVAFATAFEVLYDEIGMEIVESYERRVFRELERVLAESPVVKPLIMRCPIAIVDFPGVPFEVVENHFRKWNINARAGHFCVFRFVERLKRLPKGAPIDDYKVVRLSVGLPTTVRQVEKLEEALKDLERKVG